jgi:RNA polymerase sigma-B factor
VLALYDDEGRTQSAIGEVLGCSQMHVSRLLSRAVRQLRVALVGDPEPAAGAG